MDEDETKDNFAYFSREYAQALGALEAIRLQASTLVLMGNQEELRDFIDQFVEMSRGSAGLARERGTEHFAEWFDELIERAEELREEMLGNVES